MKQFAKLALSTSLSLALLIGCVPETVLEIGDPPIIPPLSTFSMNYGLVEAEAGRRSDESNWSFSASSVNDWRLLIDSTLRAPIASFVEARDYEPTYDHAVQAWIWEFDFEVETNIYNARLVGRANSLESRWEMYITDAGSFTEFKWYTGQTDSDGLSGTWTVTKEAGDSDPFLRIDWNRIESDAASNIRYRIVTPLTEETGSYIFFQRDNEAEFNGKYLIYTKIFNNETDILWNSEYQYGQVRDFRQFNNNDFQCWDATLQDKSCFE